jgi:hypothetical protein
MLIGLVSNYDIRDEVHLLVFFFPELVAMAL